MAHRPKERSPHRIQQCEGFAGFQRKICEFEPGDVFIRQGTPCMRLKPSADMDPVDPIGKAGTTPIVNLQTGSAWCVNANEEVYPAFDVELKYKTLRGG